MDLAELEKTVAAGESETVEFKRSTGQLTRAGETLCAFLNGQGGQVFMGVTPDGRAVGQQITDATLRAVAAMLSRFEPPALISQERLRLPKGPEILVLDASTLASDGPFTFEGRPYQRIGSTTSAMPQAHYEALLLEHAHGQSRWENAPATGVTLKQLDREEILRTVRLGIEAGRLPESTGRNIGDILDRLRLREKGELLNAAVIPEDLKRDHVSKPRNPYITDVFYRRGLVEQWGRGTNRIVEMTVQAGNPEPEFEEIAGSVVVRFRPKAGTVNPKFTEPPGSETTPGRAQAKAHDEAHEPMPEVERKLLAACAEAPKSAPELLQYLGYRGRTGNFKKALSRLLSRDLLEMTLPARPRSRFQKYRLTEEGRAGLARQK